MCEYVCLCVFFILATHLANASVICGSLASWSLQSGYFFYYLSIFFCISLLYAPLTCAKLVFFPFIFSGALLCRWLTGIWSYKSGEKKEIAFRLFAWMLDRMPSAGPFQPPPTPLSLSLFLDGFTVRGGAVQIDLPGYAGQLTFSVAGFWADHHGL